MSSKPALTVPAGIATPAVPFAAPVDRLEAGLPAPDTKRWVIRRKAAVVEAVRSGILSQDQACERYKLSPEEFFTWRKLVEDHGIPGLRVTRLQSYRGGPPRR